MTTRLPLLWIAFVLAALLTAGCGRSLPFDVSLAPTLSPEADAADEWTLASFTKRVSDRGLSVHLRGPIRQPFFAVEGHVVDIAGESVQVYEYADPDDAQAAAGAVAEDGSQVTAGSAPTTIDWISTPHFYQRDRLIVVYVGEKDDVLTALGGTLGDPFAGASAYPGPAVRTSR